MCTDRRRGFTLLELLVALSLLGVSGAAMVVVIAQTRSTMQAVHESELRVRRAAVLLSGLAREPRAALAQKAGRRRLSGHDVRISQVARDLFTIAVLDTLSQSVLVETTVHRPEERTDAR